MPKKKASDADKHSDKQSDKQSDKHSDKKKKVTESKHIKKEKNDSVKTTIKAKSDSPKSMALINIETNSLSMRIAEKHSGGIKILADLSYPLSFGKDTFMAGKISFQKAYKACEVLNNFLRTAKEYDAELIKGFATIAFREAKNREYVLDKIKIETGIDIEILDSWQDKNLLYKNLIRHMSDIGLEKAVGLMVYSGLGSLSVSVYDKGKIPFAQNFELGSLRVSEILEDIKDYTDEFHIALEEYMYSFTDILKDVIPAKNYDYFFATGLELETLEKVFESTSDTYLSITKDNFHENYDRIKLKSVGELIKEFDLDEDMAEVIIPTMSIYKVLFDITTAKEIVMPSISMMDEIIYEALYPADARRINDSFEDNTILSARILAEKFKCEFEHISIVEKFALKIFDKMKKIHNCTSRDRLLLQVAAILHDIGKYVSVRKHYIHSYDVIICSDLVGLNLTELEIIANIARYHSRITPENEPEHFDRLSREKRVLISKLTAILRIADALDRSHVNKYTDIDVKIENNTLITTINTHKNTKIEEWSFTDKSLFFKEVFGMDAALKKKAF